MKDTEDIRKIQQHIYIYSEMTKAKVKPEQ